MGDLKHAITTHDEDPQRDWLNASLTELCDHIEQTHHEYLRAELPRLTAIIAKVADVHSQAHTELRELNEAFAALRAELQPHMQKEEQVLFPAIRQLEAADGEASFPFGSVANPIRMMEHEHDNAGDGLSRIRKITNDFAVPADACNTYLAMLDGLRELETDLHQHIHKENNILFPRSLELESKRCGV
jgi:regulator of cell morphogenesis and NO signaling